jgi:RNA polymerase sigma-70 factor (ECF subfamily)
MANERTGSRMDLERERGLVVRARTDAEAFSELYDFYLPRVYGFVARRIDDRATAEEITAITFQRGLETIRSGTIRNDAFGGWLYRVAASAIVDRARRAERDLPPGVRVGDLDEPDVERRQPLVGDEVATAEFAAALDREQLRTALRRLTEPQRRILVLKFFDDLSTPELCTALGVSAGTLAIRLQRALRALHQAVPGKSTHAA